MNYDVIIIGAGAAGMICAMAASKEKSARVLLVEKSNKPGRKILMSGGGRCNFTNLHINPAAYLSQNPHFMKSALSQYTQWDFLELVKRHAIPYHEKTLGQLFCDNKADDIVNMLLKEITKNKVILQTNSTVSDIKKTEAGFSLNINNKKQTCAKLVIATGGLSIPSMGSNPFAYHIAEQFGLNIIPTRAGLVPLTLHEQEKIKFSSLTGISTECRVSYKKIDFQEGLLFTHRGLSGPAILQISSYWSAGEKLKINLLPKLDLLAYLKLKQKSCPKQQLSTVLNEILPERMVSLFIEEKYNKMKLADISHSHFSNISHCLQAWEIKPNATEGYRTAEVTLGGVDTHELSSKTLESKKIPGLFFIGESVDVTGWLGGYNFQWAWSSGWVAGLAN